MFHRKKKTNDEKTIQTTKIYISIILISAIAWITWSYILATYAAVVSHNYTVLEGLSKQVCVTVLGAIIGYLMKAWLETFCDKFNELIKGGYTRFSSIQNEQETLADEEETFFGEQEDNMSEETDVISVSDMMGDENEYFNDNIEEE